MIEWLAAAAPYAIAGANMIGGAMANQANADASKYATDKSMQDAQANRAFQADMSNTSHQREVADLKAAGLNPMLSGTGGAGASTPAGGQGTAQASRSENVIGPAIASAIEFKNMQLAQTKQAAEIETMATNNQLSRQQIAESKVRTKATEKDIPKSDLMNRTYKMLEPLLQKAEGAAQWSAKSKPYDPAVEKSPEMQKLRSEANKNNYKVRTDRQDSYRKEMSNRRHTWKLP